MMARIQTLSGKVSPLPVALVAVLVVLALLMGSVAFAQGSAPVDAAPVPSKIAKKPDAGSAWNALSAAQRHALAPLAGEWNELEAHRKKKWLVIGNEFARMSPAEQERMQERMRDWVKLTPAQRRSARENYARAKKLDADKKSAQWQKYQQLPEEQKEKLSQARLPKHVATLPATLKKAAPTIQLPAHARGAVLPPPPAAGAAVTTTTPAEAAPTEAR